MSEKRSVKSDWPLFDVVNFLMRLDILKHSVLKHF